jgi:Ca2+-dependent lipid-binding protein
MLAGALVDSAVGVLQIAVASAQGLKAVKIGGGTPDPYVTFSIGARLNLDRTKVCGFDFSISFGSHA